MKSEPPPCSPPKSWSSSTRADPLFKKDASDDPNRMGNREILENYLESPVPDGSAILVLVVDSWLKTTRLHKAIDKLGGVRLCEPMRIPGPPVDHTPHPGGPRQDHRCRRGTPGRVDKTTFQRFDNELAKLSLYQPDQPAITLKAVDALVGFQHEQQIWDMINALAAGDAQTALKKIDELWALDSKIEYTATGAVFSWIHQVLKARELVDRRLPDAQIGRELKLWPPDRAKSAPAGTHLGHGWQYPMVRRRHAQNGHGQQIQPGRTATQPGEVCRATVHGMIR